MTGPPSGGQLLSPNWNGVAGAQLNPVFVNGQFTGNFNVAAPAAGYGGDLWGAYGGGITPIGGGVTGPTGWDKPVANALSDTETAGNYEIGALSNQIIQPPGITGNISSILHFADSGNTFVDSAIPPITWTAGGTNGTATEVATPSEFPPAGALFISGTNAYIDTALIAGGALDISQLSSWTIDFWVYPTATTVTNATNNGFSTIMDLTTGFVTQFRVYMQPNQAAQVQIFGAWQITGSLTITSANGALVANQWNHVAVVRSGSTFYLGVNGVLVSGAITGSIPEISGNQLAYIGASYNSNVQSTGWDGGYFTEHRVVKGQALFTGSTYIVPSTPGGNPTLGNLPLAPPPTQTVLSQMANGALPTNTFDDSIVAGNSNAG